MIRVVVVDDHAVVREGLRRILTEAGDVAVVGEASSCAEALSLVRERRPDVVVTDITLPGRDGLELLADLKRERASLPVLVLSVHAEDQIAVRALKRGAAGYLTKDAAPEELVRALRKVHRGGKYISPAVAELLAERLGPDPQGPPHERLSDREFQVLIRIARGQKPQQISRDLGLSTKTVSTYRSRLLAKMGFKTAADIVVYCLKNGLLVS